MDPPSRRAWRCRERFEEVRMSNRSASSLRGSRSAVAIALILVGLFCAGEYISHWKGRAYYHAPRTTTLSVRARPGNAIKISAEPLPVAEVAESEILDRSMWSTYKSEAPSTLAMVEPPAGIRFSAPISTEVTDPFLEAAAQPRLAVGESEARQGISASTVSNATPIVARLSGNESSAGELWGRNWPKPLQLESELKVLLDGPIAKEHAKVRAWLSEMDLRLQELQRQPMGAEDSQPTLESLSLLVDRGYELAGDFGTEVEIAGELSRVAYALERRCAVWTSVYQCVKNGGRAYVAPRSYRIDSEAMATQLDAARRAIRGTDDSEGWEKYLLLNRIEDLANGRIGSKEDQVGLAREFLSRVTSARVTPDQLHVLRSAPIHKLADQVHPLTIKPVDYRKLIIDIEAIECNPVHRCSVSLADAIQSLRFSEHPELGAVASAINTHYRNANVRLSVSERFLNRMLPKEQVSTRPVQQRILGADTRGASHAKTNLKVDLLPESGAWKLNLALDGAVDSATQSNRNGVTFYNSSNAHVQSQRELRIDATSLQINGTPATVESTDSLRKFSTSWDEMPVVGDMIRYVAHREFLQSRPVAKRITQRLIAKQTDEEFDRELRTQLDVAQERFDTRLLGPLQSLRLSPMVMDMQTTDDRLIARYRLAGNQQLASFTPRPLAPGDSQLSLQLHQSVFNNMIEQAIDTHRDWSIQGLSDSIADLLQQPRPTLPPDTPNDVTIRFAEPNPMSIEFEDGRMWFTLRVESLEQPGRIQLKNFTIRTSYTATVNGLEAELVRDGVISIDGHRLGARDRLPLRAIFTKVFSGRTSIPMVAKTLLEDPRAQGLTVSQLEMRDGWLAIAVSDRTTAEVALGPAAISKR